MSKQAELFVGCRIRRICRLELYEGLVFTLDGAVLYRVIRWSENGAKAKADWWLDRHNRKNEDDNI